MAVLHAFKGSRGRTRIALVDDDALYREAVSAEHARVARAGAKADRSMAGSSARDSGMTNAASFRQIHPVTET